MGRRLLLVNVIILAGIYFMAKYVSTSWHDFADSNRVDLILKNVTGKANTPVPIVVPPPPEDPHPYPDFAVIPEKDLFTPDRRPAPLEPAEVAEKRPQLAKNPSLNGILLNNGKKQALITIFEGGNNPKGQSRMVGVGDNVQGYTVAEIGDTTMTIRWKNDDLVIDMFDSTPQQASAAPPRTQAAVTVITIGSSVAPVETTTASDAGGPDEKPSAEVGVSTTQGTGNQRGRQTQGTRRGGSMSGQGGTARGRGGAPSGTLGVPQSGSGSVPFTSGTNRPNQ